MAAPYRVLCVAGARPNFMKIAPILHEIRRFPSLLDATLVHTGQHYDAKLSDTFFEQLRIPHPDVNLNVGSGSHAQQTAAVMAAFEPVLLDGRPHLVLVVGDVNSTVACALVAAKLGIRVAHVEAGLRSFDRTMPEEINRVLTDQISDLLFTTEAVAAENLRREGINADTIHFVGNVMIDTLLAHRDAAVALDVPRSLGLTRSGYALLTLHRPSNVDDESAFEQLFGALAQIATDIPIVFPVHPRTQARARQSSITARLVEEGRLKLLDPLGYLEFVGLMEASRVVLTDSGGIQEETTILGVPCLTLRENTERPVTLTHGTNRLVGVNPQAIVEGWKTVAAGSALQQTPPLWDGHAAERIVSILKADAKRFSTDARP